MLPYSDAAASERTKSFPPRETPSSMSRWIVVIPHPPNIPPSVSGASGQADQGSDVRPRALPSTFSNSGPLRLRHDRLGQPQK
jgi:hypothetical protein